MTAFVDTNGWGYASDPESTDKQRVAADLLGSRAKDWVISTEVLSEFYWTATRKLQPPLPPSDAREATRLLATLPVVTLDGRPGRFRHRARRGPLDRTVGRNARRGSEPSGMR